MKNPLFRGVIADVAILLLGVVFTDGGYAFGLALTCVAVHLIGAIGLWSFSKILKRSLNYQTWMAYGAIYALGFFVLAVLLLLLYALIFKDVTPKI